MKLQCSYTLPFLLNTTARIEQSPMTLDYEKSNRKEYRNYCVKAILIMFALTICIFDSGDLLADDGNDFELFCLCPAVMEGNLH